MSLEQIQYIKSIDFNTEGYITQLIESIGKKITSSIKPHTFTYKITKADSLAPVVVSDYSQNAYKNNIFYGQLTVTFYTITGASGIGIELSSNEIILLKPIVGHQQFKNLLFDTLIDYNDLLSVSSASYYAIITFNGYKARVG